MLTYWKITFSVALAVVLFGALANFYQNRMQLVNYTLKWRRHHQGFRLARDLSTLLFMGMVVVGLAFEVLV